ncbi:MAG: cysteine desulfurase NifS [Firmicutes bacterium]|nr:cysteine desulfurase NifS [Bacillota bacterium]
MTDRIYLDHAATTAVRKEVFDYMLPFFTEHFGNPMSVHSFGRETKKYLEAARETIANCIGAEPREIMFTSSGTEADNWAIKGVLKGQSKKGKHIITSQIEHHAVLHTLEQLEQQGYEVTYLPVDREGFVDPDELKKAIRKDTILVSIMHANNEIGAIQPIDELGLICKENGIIFHVDAVQSAGVLPIDLKHLPVDLLSLSAHKFYGPKGAGALFVRKGTRIESMISGGGQERGLRGGTHNHVAIIGMGKALELAVLEMEENNKRISKLRDQLIDGLFERIPEIRLNGPRGDKRLPNNVNVSIKYIEGEGMLLHLDMLGIAASSGSACTSGSLDPSHVLLAIGLTHEIAHGSLRLSLGRKNTEADVKKVLEVLPEIVKNLRSMSPLYEG